MDEEEADRDLREKEEAERERGRRWGGRKLRESREAD